MTRFVHPAKEDITLEGVLGALSDPMRQDPQEVAREPRGLPVVLKRCTVRGDGEIDPLTSFPGFA